MVWGVLETREGGTTWLIPAWIGSFQVDGRLRAREGNETRLAGPSRLPPAEAYFTIITVPWQYPVVTVTPAFEPMPAPKMYVLPAVRAKRFAVLEWAVVVA